MTKVKKTPKTHIHITVMTVVVVIVIVALAGLFTFNQLHSQDKVMNETSADSIAGQFNSAMASGNGSEVEQLESAAFKNHLETETTNEKNTKGEHGAVVTNNYYDVEKADSDLGIRFSTQDLSGAKVTFASYSALNGTEGVSALFSEAAKTGNKITFSPSFALDLIPAGSSWQVDSVLPYVNDACHLDSGC